MMMMMIREGCGRTTSSSSLVLDSERGEIVRAFVRPGGIHHHHHNPHHQKGAKTEKALMALRNHSEAERGRRERIKCHLSMLCSLIPGTTKVSEHASWSGCFYVRILQTALPAVGAPENLIEVITGFAETGEALVSSVDKIIFVGSPGVSKMIMRKVADTFIPFIPVTLELGGKDLFIEDVDVAHVAQVAVRAALQSNPVDKIVLGQKDFMSTKTFTLH